MKKIRRFPAGPDGEYIAVGRGGWLFWYLPFGPDLRVRVQPDGNRLVIVAINIDAYMDAPPPDVMFGASIRATDLRNLPIGRLEEVVNRPEVADAVRKGLVGEKGPSLSPCDCAVGDAYDRTSDLPLERENLSLLIAGTEQRAKSTFFYEDVAKAFGNATLAGHSHPVQAIADANDTSPSTVHWWVREARRRGLLAPARRTGHR